MLNNNDQINNKEYEIALSILKKNDKTKDDKLNDWLLSAVHSILPKYHDFILKIIDRCSKKNFDNGSDKHIDSEKTREEIVENMISFMNNEGDYKCFNDYMSAMSKERKVELFNRDNFNFSINLLEQHKGLLYEVGDALNNLDTQKNALTKTLKIENNKTLYDIFTEEFDSKCQDIYEDIYKEITTNVMDKNEYDVLVKNIKLYRELAGIEIDSKNEAITNQRKEIQKKLYKCGFVENFYKLITSKSFRSLNDKYLPILDALCSKYDDLVGFNMVNQKSVSHKVNKMLPVRSFFRYLFAAKVTSNTYYDDLKELLPKSFVGFEKLFNISYDYIQNDKEF